MSRLVYLALIFLAAISPASADDVDLIGNGWYPNGFPAFCESYPGDCAPVHAKRVSFTKWLPVLDSVNQEVNRSITFRHDDGDPVGDTWTPSPTFGDCEDYAITKLRRLVAMGLPRGALRFAFGDTPVGKHATLLVWTDRGEFVLDNRLDEVIPLERVIFYTLSVQDAANPRAWWQLY